MLFNSYAFVFIFLPVFVAGYYGITYLFNEKNLFNITRKKPACAQSVVELYCVILSFVFFDKRSLSFSLYLLPFSPSKSSAFYL